MCLLNLKDLRVLNANVIQYFYLIAVSADQIKRICTCVTFLAELFFFLLHTFILLYTFFKYNIVSLADLCCIR
jgi:hypothetical protein